MKEAKKVSAALKAVERWSEYLFRRALGLTNIVWAALLAVAGLITLKVGPMPLTWLVAAVAGVVVTLYSFAWAGVTIGQKMPPMPPTEVRRRDILGGIAFFLLISALLFVAVYFGGYLKYPVALSLPPGMIMVITFYPGKKRPEQPIGGTYLEQLIIGITLIAVSPLIYALGTGDVAYACALAVTVISLGVGGMYSLLAAPRMLLEKGKKGVRKVKTGV